MHAWWLTEAEAELSIVIVFWSFENWEWSSSWNLNEIEAHLK